MKTKKLGILIVSLLMGASSIAQLTLDYATPKRTQNLNQYTSVFISSPNNNTILQNVRDQTGLIPALVNSDKYQLFSQSINKFPKA